MKIVFCLVSILILLNGCATTKDYSGLVQQEDRILTASIGSTLFRMNKSSDLPNVFGKADIWGGKIDRGYTDLKLKGITENGTLLLQVADISISSAETTMDRYKPFNQNKISVSTTTTIKNEDVSPEQTIFEFDPNKEKTLTIGGVNITFIEVTAYSVRYKLKDVSREKI